MKLNLRLEESDYLTYHLYNTSQTNIINKKRKRNRLIVPVIYFIFVVVFLFLKSYTLSILFGIFAVVWYFLYPVYEKNRYVKYYKDYINENYKDKFIKDSELELNDDFFFIQENGMESKLETEQIEKVNVISTHIFIRLKSGHSIILPKNKVDNLEGLTIWLKNLTEKLGVEYNHEEDWVWK